MLEMAVIEFHLLIIAIVSLCTNARGPLCLDCLAVRSPGQCQTVTECKSTEKCFTDFFLYNDETPAFSFGCRKPQECANEVNHNLEFCQSCCSSDMCNNNICTNGTAPPAGTPCLDCPAVSSTDQCYHITYCQEGEVCYSEQYTTQHGLTYKLGCLKKQVCHFLSAVIIGRRRSATNLKPRSTCCETAGCNYEMTTIPAKTTTTQATTQAITPAITQATTPATAQATTPATWRAKDCWDLQTIYNVTEDGVYAVQTPSGHMWHLRCDMTTNGGGWTIVQRRGDGSVSFNQTYDTYRSLFGSLNGEFWMGNDFLHEFTRDGHQTLRFDICDWNNETRWAKYHTFSVGSASDRYRLHVGPGYVAIAGDALLGHDNDNNLNGCFFSTPDTDNDKWKYGNCAANFSSGWWFNSCQHANLNGVYQFEGQDRTYYGIQWQTWINLHSFKGAEMKLRPSAANPSTHEFFTCPVI